MKARIVKMPDELWKEIQREAARMAVEYDTLVSAAEVVREACTVFLKQQETRRAKSK